MSVLENTCTEAMQSYHVQLYMDKQCLLTPLVTQKNLHALFSRHNSFFGILKRNSPCLPLCKLRPGKDPRLQNSSPKHLPIPSEFQSKEPVQIRFGMDIEIFWNHQMFKKPTQHVNRSTKQSCPDSILFKDIQHLMARQRTCVTTNLAHHLSPSNSVVKVSD